MKKIYAFILISSVSLGLFAQETIVLSLSLYDLTKEKLNTTHTDSQNNSIAIVTVEPVNSGTETMLYGKTVANPLVCAHETPSPELAEYSYIRMNGNISYKENQSPALLITLAGDDKITEIEILGYGSSAANQATPSTIAIGFSDDGINFEIDEELFNPFILLNQTDCALASNNKRTVLPGTKYIKLLHTGSYLSIGEVNMESKPMIHAIRFYAKDMGTGIDESNNASLSIQVIGRNLQLSEVADVIIYDITGKLVAQYASIEDTYLDSLKSGVYVVVASGKNEQKAIQKVLIK